MNTKDKKGLNDYYLDLEKMYTNLISDKQLNQQYIKAQQTVN